MIRIRGLLGQRIGSREPLVELGNNKHFRAVPRNHHVGSEQFLGRGELPRLRGNLPADQPQGDVWQPAHLGHQWGRLHKPLDVEMDRVGVIEVTRPGRDDDHLPRANPDEVA